MSDARWFEVESDTVAAVRHFENAVALFEQGGFEGDDLDAYRAQMAFLHAMQSGHTSMEALFSRILKLLDEELPQGGDWHVDLIRRVSANLHERPAVIGQELADAADETRRFRHVATKSYDRFKSERAIPAVLAARVIASDLKAAVASFKAVMDSEPPVEQGNPRTSAPSERDGTRTGAKGKVARPGGDAL